jgi:hypothetical protein
MESAPMPTKCKRLYFIGSRPESCSLSRPALWWQPPK